MSGGERGPTSGPGRSGGVELPGGPGRPIRIRRGLLLLLALAALGLGACSDDGPSGPGPVSATVTGAALGGAVLEVTGTGITGFEGAGSSQVFHGSTAPGVYRLVVVGPGAGELRFQILVEDRSGMLPTGVVISAVDGANLPFATTTGMSLTVAR